MTMPRTAVEALRKIHGCDGLRLVYPLDDWSLSATEGKAQFLLTLKTPDGFEITFAIDPPDLARMTATIADRARDLAEPLRLN
jgi:hypothetical protein